MSTTLQSAESDRGLASSAAGFAKPPAPKNSSTVSHPVVRIVLVLVLATLLYVGFIRYSHPPTYTASAIVNVPPASGALKDISEPQRVNSLLLGAESETRSSRNSHLIVSPSTMAPNTYSLQVTSDSPAGAAAMAGDAAQAIVDQTKILQRLSIRRNQGATALATEIEAPTKSMATLSPTTPITPQGQSMALTSIAVLMLVCLFGLVVSLSPERQTAAPPTRPDDLDMPIAASTKPAMAQVEEEAPQAPVAAAAPATLAYMSLNTDGTVAASLDLSLLKRLSEFKAAGTDKGCVLIVSDASTPPASGAGISPLNAAQAALAFTRQICAVAQLSTLLIDCGSSAWSAQRSDQGARDSAPDVLNLPTTGSGVYEILKNGIPKEQWSVPTEDSLGIATIASGTVLSRWPEILRSEEMRKFIDDARTLAQVVIIYGPAALDRPETVRVLGDWSNGIVLVGAPNAATDAAESHAVEILRSANAKIFGRIALR